MRLDWRGTYAQSSPVEFLDVVYLALAHARGVVTQVSHRVIPGAFSPKDSGELGASMDIEVTMDIAIVLSKYMVQEIATLLRAIVAGIVTQSIRGEVNALRGAGY